MQARRERGDMVEAYKIITGKVDVQPSIWFSPLTTREGAASTRATSGHLNLARREASSEVRKNQFSVRVVPLWNYLTKSNLKTHSIILRMLKTTLRTNFPVNMMLAVWTR